MSDLSPLKVHLQVQAFLQAVLQNIPLSFKQQNKPNTRYCAYSLQKTIWADEYYHLTYLFILFFAYLFILLLLES